MQTSLIKRILLTGTLTILLSTSVIAQFVHKIKADSVLITNDSCTAELNLENSTKDVNGFLYNKGKGRTEFRRGLIQINDSIYIIGGDTLNVGSGNDTCKWSSQGANIYYTNGRVGIGVSSPAYRLHVDGGTAVPAYFKTNLSTVGYVGIENIYNGGNAAAGLRFFNDNGLTSQLLSYSTSGFFGPNALLLHSAAGSVRLISNTAHVEFATGGPFPANVKARVLNNGNFLINTDIDNGTKFKLHGTAYITDTLKTPNIIQKNVDTTTYKLVVVDGSGNHFKSNWQSVPAMLTATSVLNFGSTAAGTSTDLTITVNGAVDGDAVSLGVPNASTTSNGSFSAWVSAANTITVRFSNNDLTNALDPASGTFRVSVIRY
jgi:hypothetical protein